MDFYHSKPFSRFLSFLDGFPFPRSLSYPPYVGSAYGSGAELYPEE